MKNIKSPLNSWVIKCVNGINFFVDLYLRNYLDAISDEFSFENLYYLSKKRKTQWKKSGKNSRYYISQKHLSQKGLTTDLSAIEYRKLEKYVSGSKPLRSS